MVVLEKSMKETEICLIRSKTVRLIFCLLSIILNLVFATFATFFFFATFATCWYLLLACGDDLNGCETSTVPVVTGEESTVILQDSLVGVSSGAIGGTLELKSWTPCFPQVLEL